MAVRVPPVLPVPPSFRPAITVAMDKAAPALQHQDELTALLSWTQTLDPPCPFDVCVEIGTHYGGTLACWAELARTHGSDDPLVVSIDLPLGYGGPPQWGGLPYSDTLARNAAFAARYPYVRSLLANSQLPSTRDALLDLLGGRLIDFLFIDGDHTLSGVSADYALYAPLVRPGGVIAFHDVNDTVQATQQDFAVPAFFAMLPDPKMIFSVGAEWGGIGALQVPWDVADEETEETQDADAHGE